MRNIDVHRANRNQTSSVRDHHGVLPNVIRKYVFRFVDPECTVYAVGLRRRDEFGSHLMIHGLHHCRDAFLSGILMPRMFTPSSYPTQKSDEGKVTSVSRLLGPPPRRGAAKDPLRHVHPAFKSTPSLLSCQGPSLLPSNPHSGDTDDSSRASHSSHSRGRIEDDFHRVSGSSENDLAIYDTPRAYLDYGYSYTKPIYAGVGSDGTGGTCGTSTRCLTTFACPVQARTEANAWNDFLCSREQVVNNNDDGGLLTARRVATCVPLRLPDARHIANNMKLPVIVVLNSFCQQSIALQDRDDDDDDESARVTFEIAFLREQRNFTVKDSRFLSPPPF